MDRLKRISSRAKADKDVLAVVVFGSFARKEKFRDIDICIVLKKKLDNGTMSKKRLFYVAESGLDVHIFQQLPLYIRVRVLKEGKIVYCKDMDALYNIALQTAREFGYFKTTYEGYLEAVKHG